MTGGLIVALVLLLTFFRKKELRRGFQITLFVVFLIMAFFNTWKTAKDKQVNAEAGAARQKQRADYNQKRINELSDKGLIGERTNSPNVVNSRVGAISENKGVISIGQQGGITASSVIITNNGEKFKADLESFGALDVKPKANGLFEIHGMIRLKSPFTVGKLHIGVQGAEGVSFMPVGGGAMSGMKQGRRSGLAFQELQNATPGEYRLTVISTNKSPEIIYFIE